jgi:formylglycine-generating enzyme required for sulfatase activity
MVTNSTGYRLPTEAQWEYACRAGTTTAFNVPVTGGSNSINDYTGWYSSNTGSVTHQVGLKSPNAWGLYDMHGNVNEWCWDWYGTYPAVAQTNPTGAVSGDSRVLRGGSYFDAGMFMRSAFRFPLSPATIALHFGFRVVRP